MYGILWYGIVSYLIVSYCIIYLGVYIYILYNICMHVCRHVFTHVSSFFWVCCMSSQKPRQKDWVMLWVTASSFGAHKGDMSNTQDPNKDQHLELLFHLQDSELRIATDILVLQSWTSARTFTPRRIPISVLDTRVGHQVQQVDDELGMPPLPDYQTPCRQPPKVVWKKWHHLGFQHVVGWGPSTVHDLMILKVVGRL